jgi:hypothetical protein
MQRLRIHTRFIVLSACFICAYGAFSHAQDAAAQPSISSAPAAAPAGPAKPVTEEPEPSDTPHVAVESTGVDPITGIPYYKEIREDWSSLEVGSSELHPEAPLVTPADDTPDTFTRTLVALKWRPGDALDVYVILPKGVTKPPAVLYLYNYSEDTDRFKNDGWCRRVTGGGVAAIGFVSALSGQRFHDRPMKQWFVSELQESLGSTVHDIKFILDYLASRGDVDMDRVGMFGQGSGATIALLASAADSRIKAVDALDPWGDWPVWLAKSPVGADDPEKAARLKAAFLKQVAPLDPVQWLPKVQASYVRIQQNLEDVATPRASMNHIKAAAPKRTVVVRYDSTASFMRSQGRGRLFDWIKDAVNKPRLPVKPPAPKGTTVASRSAAQSSAKHSVRQ